MLHTVWHWKTCVTAVAVGAAISLGLLKLIGTVASIAFPWTVLIGLIIGVAVVLLWPWRFFHLEWK